MIVRLLFATVMLAAAAAGALLLVARPFSRDTGTAATSPGPSSVQEAAQFKDYPLLWLGESFEGLPLTGIVRSLAGDDPNRPVPTAQDDFTFIYGDCTPGNDGGCAPPLQVLVEPRCFNPPEAFNYLRSGTNPVRGGAQLKADVPGGPVLWTGDVSVSIFGSADLLDKVIAALTPINAAAIGSASSSVLVDANDPRSPLAPPRGGPCAKIKGRDRANVPYIGLNDPTPGDTTMATPATAAP